MNNGITTTERKECPNDEQETSLQGDQEQSSRKTESQCSSLNSSLNHDHDYISHAGSVEKTNIYGTSESCDGDSSESHVHNYGTLDSLEPASPSPTEAYSESNMIENENAFSSGTNDYDSDMDLSADGDASFPKNASNIPGSGEIPTIDQSISIPSVGNEIIDARPLVESPDCTDNKMEETVMKVEENKNLHPKAAGKDKRHSSKCNVSRDTAEIKGNVNV